jgi:CBS domain-containing protein
MFARNLISDSIPPVKPTDDLESVLLWMNEFKVAHLPVVQNEQLLGIISEDDLLEMDVEDGDRTVSDVALSIPADACVPEEGHVYEALKIMSDYKLHVLPVVDEHRTYLGLLTRGDMLNHLAEVTGAREPGGIVVLEVQYNSYVPSQIAKICESNDAKILSLTLSSSPDHGTLYVTVKLNIRELSRLLSTFERFEYKINRVVFDSEQLMDFREDYENLLRYLNI